MREIISRFLLLFYSCGDCPAGYTGDGKTCSDIDECLLDSCDHICVNSPGSFTCACRSGYQLNIDGSTCDGEFAILYSIRLNIYLSNNLVAQRNLSPENLPWV